jgi:hypothetical protein
MLPTGRLLTCITYELSASTMGFYAATCSSLSEPRPRYLRRRCGVLQTRTSRRQLRHFSGPPDPKKRATQRLSLVAVGLHMANNSLFTNSATVVLSTLKIERKKYLTGELLPLGCVWVRGRWSCHISVTIYAASRESYS